jgi:hypothetical protein
MKATDCPRHWLRPRHRRTGKDLAEVDSESKDGMRGRKLGGQASRDMREIPAETLKAPKILFVGTDAGPALAATGHVQKTGKVRQAASGQASAVTDPLNGD